MNPYMTFESLKRRRSEWVPEIDAAKAIKLPIRKRVRSVLAALALGGLSATALNAELIPASRVVNWTAGVAVGVPGGIPTNRTRLINVTLPPYNANNSGTSDASAAIQAAIDAASPNDVVYLPAGRYLISNTISIRHNKDSITVRGAGMENTIIDARVNTVFTVGSGSDYQWAWPVVGNNVTAGMTQGSTEITIADTSAFSTGQIIQVAVENQTDPAAIAAGATPIVSVGGYAYLRRQLTRVTSKTSSTLKIFPPIHFTPDAGLKARVNVAQFQTDFVGIEDMTLDGTNGQMIFPIMFQQCYGSWISSIKIINTQNYGVFFTDSLNCEARKCVIRDRKVGGSNGAGVLLGHVGNSLIEDNIIVGIFPAVEVNTSSTGNVVAYNVLENSIGGTLNTNHAPHNSFNLYEGNITPNMQADGYFGSASDDTFFRNWMHGTDKTLTLRTFMTSLNRFTRNYSFVGNIFGEAGTTGTSPYSFGNPNMGNSMYNNTARPSQNRFWRDWGATGTVTSRSSDSAGSVQLNGGGVFVGQLVILRWENDNNLHRIISVSSVNGSTITWNNGTGTPVPAQGTVVKVYFESGGYQELDEDVGATTVLKANYFFGTRSIPQNEAIGGDSLPASLFRTSKPEWFGTLKWPPFDPFDPAPSFSSIPAGFRYINLGNEPPAGVAAAPSNVRVLRQ